MRAFLVHILTLSQIVLPAYNCFADNIPRTAVAKDFDSRLELRLALHPEREELIKLASELFAKFDQIKTFGGTVVRKPNFLKEEDLNYFDQSTSDETDYYLERIE